MTIQRSFSKATKYTTVRIGNTDSCICDEESTLEQFMSSPLLKGYFTKNKTNSEIVMEMQLDHGISHYYNETMSDMKMKTIISNLNSVTRASLGTKPLIMVVKEEEYGE